MENLIRVLEQQREAILERGVALAGATRDRSLDALGRVRSGALDWHQTLTVWRSELEGRDARWARLVDLQVRVLDRFDRGLVSFGERVRAEIERLSRLELSATAPAVEAPTEKSAAAAKSEPKQAAAKKATAAGAKKAPKTKKRPAAKAKKNPAAKAKKNPAAKAKSNGARARKPSTRLVMPIADYDELTAKEVLAEVPRLSDAQCRTVLGHEQAHKARKTVIAALSTRVSS